uniref:Uncharacterized protein n=1 Tax=Cannabis sativa TaxID=3483 RepID=A0A803PUN1_CANSA
MTILLKTIQVLVARLTSTAQSFNFFLESFGTLFVKEPVFLLYRLKVNFVYMDCMTDDLGVNPDHVLTRPSDDVFISPYASYEHLTQELCQGDFKSTTMNVAMMLVCFGGSADGFFPPGELPCMPPLLALFPLFKPPFFPSLYTSVARALVFGDFFLPPFEAFTRVTTSSSLIKPSALSKKSFIMYTRGTHLFEPDWSSLDAPTSTILLLFKRSGMSLSLPGRSCTLVDLGFVAVS